MHEYVYFRHEDCSFHCTDLCVTLNQVVHMDTTGLYKIKEGT
jgi:hypothetical protein